MASQEKEKLYATTALAFLGLSGLYLLGVYTQAEKSGDVPPNPEQGPTIGYDQPNWPPPLQEPSMEGQLVIPQPPGVVIPDTSTQSESDSRALVHERLNAKMVGERFAIVDRNGEVLIVEKGQTSLRYTIVEGPRSGQSIVVRNIFEVR